MQATTVLRHETEEYYWGEQLDHRETVCLAASYR